VSPGPAPAGIPATDGHEWLEADGRGGFAMGPVTGARTRRYHAWLLPVLEPAGQRFVLVSGAEIVVVTGAGQWPLAEQRYAGGVLVPDRAQPAAALLSFTSEPWPTWCWRLPDGTEIEGALVVQHGGPATVVSWTCRAARGPVSLRVRPLLAGRDYHALHHENPAFRFAAAAMPGAPDRLVVAPYPDLPAVVMASNGQYRHDPHWYRGFEYREELARGFDATEDLAAPGEFSWPLADASGAIGEPAHLVLAAAGPQIAAALPAPEIRAAAWAATIRASERRRRQGFAHTIDRAADAYLVETAAGASVIAGYPWFTDWGRDTFIALRGLALATGRLGEARAVLLRWAGAVSRGMLPNRFLRLGEEPEYNSVDAALWFVIVAHEYLLAAATVDNDDRALLVAAIVAIVAGHVAGTRWGIHVAADGLLAAGQPGVQLTWMDAKIGDWVVTPRIGKPVEVQALWLNALLIAADLLPGDARAPHWRALFARGHDSFATRFWSEAQGFLFDVVDVDHAPGAVDARLRPNQIFAVGGLPLALLEGAQARSVVDAVEAQLVVPLGLRSLAPREPGYCAHYAGDPRARDAAYHQGTVWPWLMGPFVEAWLRVRGDSAPARAEARRRFLAPLLAHLGEVGVGHVSEVADGDPPHRAGGCPFQAWSLGELLRLDKIVLRR
jgi:predicted glycogen debranching enzyme